MNTPVDPWRLKLRGWYCEICGKRAKGLAPAAFAACAEHWNDPKPEPRRYQFLTGEHLEPETDTDPDEEDTPE